MPKVDLRLTFFVVWHMTDQVTGISARERELFSFEKQLRFASKWDASFQIESCDRSARGATWI